jgi:hypothetical protein
VEHRAAEIAATGQVKHAEEKKKHEEHHVYLWLRSLEANR